MHPALGVQSLNHWTAREEPCGTFLTATLENRYGVYHPLVYLPCLFLSHWDAKPTELRIVCLSCSLLHHQGQAQSLSLVGPQYMFVELIYYF